MGGGGRRPFSEAPRGGGASAARTNRAPKAACATAPAPGIRLVALDLDGVVWKGGEVLPGVIEALAQVLQRGLDLRYVSNNSTAHRETVSERLASLGLPAGAERVLTSGFVTACWLRGRLPEGAPVMVVGEKGLLRELREAGLDAYHARETGAAAGPVSGVALAEEPTPTAEAHTAPAAATPAAVVVGMDRSFSYETLAAAQKAIRDGALFVATNRDVTFPTEDRLLPGAGSIVAAVAAAAEQEPVLMGKPGLALAEILEIATGVPAKETLLVGDRLSTDIAMGRAAGMVTALVLTGVTDADSLHEAETAAAAGAAPEGGVATAAGEDAVLPNHVLTDLSGLPALMDELARPRQAR
jgi:4-nitrophenyl phosphatase